VDNPLDKVGDLIALALNSEVSPEESRTAAVLAIKIIQEYDLLRAVRECEVSTLPSKKEPLLEVQPEGLSEKVKARGNLFVKFLIQESIQGRFPVGSAKGLTAQAIEEGVIFRFQGEAFRPRMQRFLRKKANNGILISTRKGYSLKRS
jgi:hypothetical protein